MISIEPENKKQIVKIQFDKINSVVFSTPVLLQVFRYLGDSSIALVSAPVLLSTNVAQEGTASQEQELPKHDFSINKQQNNATLKMDEAIEQMDGGDPFF